MDFEEVSELCERITLPKPIKKIDIGAFNGHDELKINHKACDEQKVCCHE